MESRAIKPELVQLTRYTSYLLICLLVSIGFCFSLLPAIPSDTRGYTVFHNGELAYTFTHMCLAIILVFIEVMIYQLIRRRDRYHQHQEILWPLRCQHCARAVGMKDGRADTDGQEHFPRDIGTANTACQPCDADKETTFVSQSECLQSRSSSLPNEELNSSTTSAEKDKDYHYSLYTRPHKSLLHISIILGIVAVMNIPVQIVGAFICFGKSGNSSTLNFALAIQIVTDINFVILIVLDIVFLTTYYDAVFVEPKFSYILGIMFGVTIWISAMKTAIPLSQMFKTNYNKLDYPCKLDGIFGHFLLIDEQMLTPFYAECGIIASGVLWHMWHSMLPKSYLKLASSPSEIGSLSNASPRFCITFVSRAVKRLCCRKMLMPRNYGDETESLLIASAKRKTVTRTLLMQIALLLFIVLIYFSVSMAIVQGKEDNITEEMKTYLKWCIQMAFYVPLLAMIRYQIFLCDSINIFPLKQGISSIHGLIESQDIILLFSCMGIFILNIFRFVGSVGLLFRATLLDPEILTLACFGVMFAIYQMYAFWKMTMFLFVVQRQVIRDKLIIKWTLLCLVYVTALNTGTWILDSLEINNSPDLKVYYREVGESMGIILEPISSLYGLHAATISLETCRELWRELIH